MKKFFLKTKKKKEKGKKKRKINTSFTLCLLEVTSKEKNKNNKPKSTPTGLDKREALHTLYQLEPNLKNYLYWQQCRLSQIPKKS